MAEGTITAPAPTTTMPAPAGATQASIMSAPSEPAAPAGDSMADAFGKLEARGQTMEQIATAEPPRAKPKAPTKSAQSAKPTEEQVKPEIKQEAKPELKEPNKPIEAAKPPEEVKAAEASKTKPASGWQRFHEAEKQIKELTTKLAEKEKAATMPDDHPELVRMRSEIQKREQRLAEVENHLRFRDYEESEDYQKNYQRPFLEAAAAANQRATEMKVVDAATGTARLLTTDEFFEIVNIRDGDKALAAAEQLFGEGSLKANFIMERRHEVLVANQRADKAKEDFKKHAAEITRKKQEEFQRQGTERSTLFKKLMTDGIEKDPSLYKPEEGDAEGNALLENGFRLVDRVFSGGPPEMDGGTPMSPQEMIAAHAEIRNNAAAFPRIAHKYKAAMARIAELEAELEEYSTSTPAKGEAASGGKGPQREDDMESILSGLDKRSS